MTRQGYIARSANTMMNALENKVDKTVNFNVSFCSLCPRRSSCHYRGCIFDGEYIDLSDDEQMHFIMCEIIERDREILERLRL